MIVTPTRDLDRFLAYALTWARVSGTKRELAAALLFDVAGPDPSKAPGTTLMLNRN
jgi:hypothetical protein